MARTRKAIAYIRVSTKRQARAACVSEAQRAAIAAFAKLHNFGGEYQQVETGKGFNTRERRPQWPLP